MESSNCSKLLIIHPDDRSTDILKRVYASLPSATVITGGVSKLQVKSLILSHDRIVMMGHGDRQGLYGGDQFGHYIIDKEMIDFFKGKECIFIWCYANMFVEKYNLSGFYTGMFISEKDEAIYHCMLADTTEEEVQASNEVFTDCLTSMVEAPLDQLFSHIMNEYAPLSSNSQVVAYNSSRLRYNGEDVVSAPCAE